MERGLVTGLLIGEGHFGGDGKQPQITLKMHTRHEAIFHWLQGLFPRARLYGPYHHDGRSYYQWMARGRTLVEDVLPVVESVLTEEIDTHVSTRIRDMRARYADLFARYERHAERQVRKLAGHHALPPRAHAQMATIIETLAADDRAPTTVRDPKEAIDVHLADSLAGLEIDYLRSARHVADIGAGAGFPGLALAIALPDSEVRLVESQSRKCQFLRRAAAAAGVDNARVVQSRIEEWSEGLGRNDVVVARALAPQPVVLEYAAPLLEMGGVLVDWRGQRNVDEETDALHAAEQLGLRRLEISHTEPYEGARDHHLHVFEKAAETPLRFPRRAGVARKRPLGLRAAK